MRLVLIINGLNGEHGGIQRVVRSILAAVRNDPIPTVFWTANDHSVGIDLSSIPGLSFRCFAGRYRAMLWAALTHSLPQGIRGIFCFHLLLVPVAAILAWRLRCPFRVCLYGVEAWGPMDWKRRVALRQATMIDGISEYTLKTFHRIHPEFMNKPGKVLKLGLNEDFVDAPPAPEDFLQRYPQPFFLTVARFAEDYKGEGILFKAFVAVHQCHSKVHLVCVGDGPTRPRLEQEVAQAGLMDAVQFSGRVSESELNALYKGCLGFVMLSEGEGFGIVYVEAMFHGKPCLATNADASKELVQDGITGFTVPPRDVAAAEAALLRLVEDPALARRLGEEGQRQVLANFMPLHFQQRLRDLMAC